MLEPKKTLLGPPVLRFTGCRAVLPGHFPLGARAASAVPGAPASSLLTGSQPAVLKPGAEIWAPVWVATALLCTVQPLAPRLVRSELPVPAGLARRARAAGLRDAP